ncbi:adhesion G protein-coupled receptor A3 [Nilaparvata lugens]|uniref:adhesion G protein-coupled receptor A3 n=1 Tax=Nilaparvata lugens TaxID=108931 RepID=UPI00193CAAF8|nr:adhesion G protein-coupled receptor A3 [Nilaparvata lugens]
MGSKVKTLLSLSFVLSFITQICSESVAVTCTKTYDVKPNDKQILDWFRLRCGGENGIISSLGELQSKWFKNATEVTDLDLSQNNLTHITANLPYLPNLLKLDLSRNRISKIDLGAFSNLTSLKTLDLSFNKLKHLSRAYFEGLSNLERLRLSDNQISQIKEGTFDDLVSLKKINLTMNPLICDCSLWWLPGWARNESVKLNPLPKCSGPPPLRGQTLRKLKPGVAYAYCDWPTSQTASHATSFLELRPQHNQVVFEGDSLKLQCRVVKESASEDSVIYWKWAGLNPIEVFDGAIVVSNRSIKDSGLIESVIQVEYLTSNYSGQWDCHLTSSVANQSTSVAIVVITEATHYCPITTTSSNRGFYVWPKTIANNVVELPCAVPTDGDEDGAARHTCNETGHWSTLDTSACPFYSEVTRTLYQFSQMNTSLVNGNALETINKFCNYTNDAGRIFTDEMDIIFITRTVKNYLIFVKNDPEVGKVLLEIIHGLMRQPHDLLDKAQQLERSASILVSAIEEIVKLSSSFQWHSTPNQSLLVEGYAVSWGSFQGLSCTRYGYLKRSDKLFKCSTVNNVGLTSTNDLIMEASVRVHPSLFHHTETKSSYQLMVSMFENSKLFPRLNANDSMAITSSVVGVKIADVEIAYLAEPVYVMVQVEWSGWSGGLRPVWWDAGNSQWRDDVCKVSNLSSPLLTDVLVFQCYKLGYFAVLQDVSHLNLREEVPAKWRLAPPAVYVGTFIGATCMLVASVSYALYHTCIQMPTKAKHSLANTWLAMALLFITYSVGIYQTEDRNTCQIIGLVLHYLTLCSLFWMALTINGLYKRVSKRDPVETPGGAGGRGGEEVGEEVVVGQPLVGVYLVGWGIALLLVGLSGAVNLRGYAAVTHCSLGPGPGVSALVFPSGCLGIYLLLRCVMVRCAALSLDSNAQLSEGTQATDLELTLVDNHHHTLTLCNDLRMRSGSVRSVATPSSQLEDPEHSPSSHLKAFLIVLTLFVSVWCCAALTTLTPLHLPYEETVFSVLYALLLIILGMFVVFFYCLAREDVRQAWFSLKPCCRSRLVTDSRPAPPPLVSSSDSLNSSSGRKSAATGLNSTLPIGAAATRDKNADLMLMHRRHYRPDNNGVIGSNEVDLFYNPHQIGVARKFFKKQRRKQNNVLAGSRRSGGGRGVITRAPGAAGGCGGGQGQQHQPACGAASLPPHLQPQPVRGVGRPLYARLRSAASRSTQQRQHTINWSLVIGLVKEIEESEMGQVSQREYFLEDQLTSVVSSCCGGVSGADTDCGRDISCQQSCGSSHMAVSDQSQSQSDGGSHLYATIDPPSPRPHRPGHRSVPRHRPPLPPPPPKRAHSDSENRFTDDSNASKRETSV